MDELKRMSLLSAAPAHHFRLLAFLRRGGRSCVLLYLDLYLDETDPMYPTYLGEGVWGRGCGGGGSGGEGCGGGGRRGRRDEAETVQERRRCGRCKRRLR
jgi:hypothetical protein